MTLDVRFTGGHTNSADAEVVGSIVPDSTEIRSSYLCGPASGETTVQNPDGSTELVRFSRYLNEMRYRYNTSLSAGLSGSIGRYDLSLTGPADVSGWVIFLDCKRARRPVECPANIDRAVPRMTITLRGGAFHDPGQRPRQLFGSGEVALPYLLGSAHYYFDLWPTQ